MFSFKGMIAGVAIVSSCVAVMGFQQASPVGDTVTVDSAVEPDSFSNLPPEMQVLHLQKQLKRQERIALNARLQLAAIREEIKLKDELIQLAVERNQEMFDIASDIVNEAHKQQRCWDALSLAGVFVQSGQVKLQNLKQSYEDKLHAARFYSSTLPPSIESRMTADLSEQDVQEEQASE